MSRNRIEVEECRILDINVFKKVCKSGGDSGKYRWLVNEEVDAQIGYSVYMYNKLHGFLNLNYTITSTQNEHVHSIKIISSKCNYGGYRYWIQCPYCSRKVSKLYLPPNDEVFACRYCLRLTYKSKSKNYHNHMSKSFNRIFNFIELYESTKRIYYKGKLTRKAQRLLRISRESRFQKYF